MEYVIFTVCSICYLPKALVLAESVYKKEKSKVIIYLADCKSGKIMPCEYAQIEWIEDQGIPHLKKLTFIYDVTELSTCVKPFLALKLLERYSGVIYLDPDICVYSPLTEIKNELKKSPILLTPHYITPIESRIDNYDLAMMRFGSFNLGFFAVSATDEALMFLNWWSERCINLGFFETQFGLSVDQKWASIAPCFFPHLKILFNVGVNMAFWNLHERELSKKENNYIVNEKEKLIFFHFSSFDIKNPKIISKRPHKWNKSGRRDLDVLCEDYAKALHEKDYDYSSTKYGFDYMNKGSYISPTLRRAYAAVVEELVDFDPFEENGLMAEFIRANHLCQKGNMPFETASLTDKAKHSRKFKIIYFCMRLILKFLGPNSFSNLSRLLVYLSSFRQNRDLWKIPKALRK